MVVVTAGNSSAESVRTAAELVRTSGLDLQYAAVLRTERTDESFSAGYGSDRLAAVPLEVGHDQPLLDFEEPSNGVEQLAAEATGDAGNGHGWDVIWADAPDAVTSDDQQELVATVGLLGAEPFLQSDESQAADDEEAAAAERLEQQAAYEQVAIEEHEEAPESSTRTTTRSRWSLSRSTRTLSKSSTTTPNNWQQSRNTKRLPKSSRSPKNSR